MESKLRKQWVNRGSKFPKEKIARMMTNTIAVMSQKVMERKLLKMSNQRKGRSLEVKLNSLRRGKENLKRVTDGGNDDDGGGSDDNAEEAPKTKSGKVTKNKQAKAVTTSKEKVISQKGKPSKKKAK